MEDALIIETLSLDHRATYLVEARFPRLPSATPEVLETSSRWRRFLSPDDASASGTPDHVRHSWRMAFATEDEGVGAPAHRPATPRRRPACTGVHGSGVDHDENIGCVSNSPIHEKYPKQDER